MPTQDDHRTPDSLVSDEIQPLMGVAVEMRQRVTDQLAKIPSTEFTNIPYTFNLTHQSPVADAPPSPATLPSHTPEQLPEHQQGPCAPHGSLAWGLLADHQHTSGELVRVLHAGVNLA